MKKIAICLAALSIFVSCNSANEKATDPLSAGDNEAAGENYAIAVNSGHQPDTVKTSVRRRTNQIIAGNEISIDYYSPGVRNRIIWGGLVPYNQVWVTGAHGATKISFTKDIRFAGQTVAAGTYAIFTIPGQHSWTFILNKNYEQHLTDDYQPAEDVLRMPVVPAVLQDTIHRLTYSVEPGTNETGTIRIHWEKVGIAVPFAAITNTK